MSENQKQKYTFTGFYTSVPFWFEREVEFTDDSFIYDQNTSSLKEMSEEVFFEDNENYQLKVCRDGLIMLRIAALEPNDDTFDDDQPRKWFEYLDYLNAFYLLLDSSTLEISRRSIFHLHEITHREALRVDFYDGECHGNRSSSDANISSYYSDARILHTYNLMNPLKCDRRIRLRQIVKLDEIKYAASLFAKVAVSPDLAKVLASFARGVSAYKTGNYETAIVLTWFVTEAVINHIWESHIDNLNEKLPDGGKRINSDRKSYFRGRDFTISIVSNLLELWELIPNTLFKKIDEVRKLRNAIAHGDHKLKPEVKQVRLAINTAQEMIELQWKFRFMPNTSRTASCL